MRRIALFRPFLGMSLAFAAAFSACGGRTGLPEEFSLAEEPDDAGSRQRDGSIGPLLDALPPLDVDRPEVNRNDCAETGGSLIYLVTSSAELVSFDPSTTSFRRIGVLACPTPEGASPYSMAVDRKGTAYVLYETDGLGGAQFGAGLYRVSTANASCSKTAYSAGVGSEFDLFGMAFATDDLGPEETLYVASGLDRASSLAAIDTINFTLHTVGDLSPSIAGAELTGSGAGDLFAFYADHANDARDSYVMQIDKESATIVAQDLLPGVRQGEGWAFAVWGGDFWLFTSPSGDSSRVLRFRPRDRSLVAVAEFPSRIVGAGVSTCAPQ